MKSVSKTELDGYVDLLQIAAPGSPAAGLDRLYFKTDGVLYKKTPAGVETTVGGGASTPAPTLPTDTGVAGNLAYDATHIYVCVATNTWRRALLKTFAIFTYVSDGDTNGVFYYLGTNAGADPWTNPHTAGFLTIAASNIGTGSLAQTVDRTNNDNWDAPQAGNWWQVDFGASRTLVVSAWSFQQRSITGNNPTQLTLAGSNDGTNFTTILGTQTISNTSANQWNSFTIAGQTTAYRYIRMTRTANDSSGGTYFTIGDWELYGTLTGP